MNLRQASGFSCFFVLSLSGLSWAESSHVVQVGAFPTETEAISKAVELENAGFAPVAVRPEEADKTGLLYKVLVGEYASRKQADQGKQLLASRGTSGFVRNIQNYDKSAVREVVRGELGSLYFSDAAPASSDSVTTLTEELLLKRNRALGEETTSPESLENYRTFISTLSDGSAAKSSEIITLAWYSFSGKSAYDSEDDDLFEVNALLRQVGNGEVAAVPEQRIAAREILAHSLHYYSRDYANALAAYRQILSEHVTKSNLAGAAKARTEIAAASYELVKNSGFNRDEFLVTLADLWSAAVRMQEPILADGVTTGSTIRDNTARIGLMLSEVLIEQKRWDEAKSVAESLISMYEPYAETIGLRAEAYCHLACIGIGLNDKAVCDEAVANATGLAEKAGRVWGDVSRDPLWKVLTYKNAAAYHFNEPQLVREEILQEMTTRFPDHPDLSKYVQGSAE